jgi:hypothetical protein
MTDVNKAIMRCLTKNLAMFGLGLYIYAGEDLPEIEKELKNEYREKLIAKLKEKKIDIKAYAAEKGLDENTTAERYTELLKEFEGA